MHRKDMAGNTKIWRETQRYGGKHKDMAGKSKDMAGNNEEGIRPDARPPPQQIHSFSIELMHYEPTNSSNNTSK